MLWYDLSIQPHMSGVRTTSKVAMPTRTSLTVSGQTICHLEREILGSFVAAFEGRLPWCAMAVDR